MGTYPLQGGTQPTLEAGTTCCQVFRRVKVLGIPMGEGDVTLLPHNSKESPGGAIGIILKTPLHGDPRVFSDCTYVPCNFLHTAGV